MTRCPWTPEDCAIWKGITRRFRERLSDYKTDIAVQRMRDTFHNADRVDGHNMSNWVLHRAASGHRYAQVYMIVVRSRMLEQIASGGRTYS